MSEIQDRLSTALADRYVIEGELGHGGMATVYLARDLKHDRGVALKVLRPELAAVIGSERFLGEIKVTANLQHPHILPLHDSGEADSFLFYVMPHVEGESLREKLDREKQFGIDEAIEITKAVASALDYAHRHGVVHRDIKPENILLHDGQPMVADFGIALAVSQAGGTRLTETGLSVGTPHYMSPEQAMGDRELDARSDIYSLGAMLYEMLSGDPPYTGSTAQAIVAKVITEKATPLSVTRDTVPAHVSGAVAKALNKLPADRFSTAQSFAEALTTASWVSDTAAIPSATAPVETSTRRVPAWAAPVAVAAALGLGVVVGTQFQSDPVRPLVRYYLPLESGADDGLAISPDGLSLVYAKRLPGPDTLFLRRAEGLTSEVLYTSLNINDPFFSPDGTRIGFSAGGGRLMWMGLQGTPPATLTDSASGSTASWGDDGNVYFVLSGSQGRTLARKPTGGGAIERIHQDSARVILGAEVLPGSRGVVVTKSVGTALSTLAGVQDFSIGVLDLESGALEEITRGTRARFAKPGHLLYQTAGGVLFALPFDADRMEVVGTAIPVADSVADFAVAESGTLIRQVSSDRGSLAGGAGLSLVSRDGVRTPLPVPRVLYRNLSLSPDAERLVLEIQEDAAQDGGYIALLELADSVLGRLTFGGLDTYPSWTPDGTRIVFSRMLNGERDLYWKQADGRGTAERLFERPGEQFEPFLTSDGGTLIYRDGNADVVGADLGIRMRSLQEGTDTTLVNRAGALERGPTLSPDGRWLAYISNEVGVAQIFVRPFPDGDAGTQWQISSNGGTEPLWSHSGRELFYKSGGYLMAAQIQTTPTFAVRARHQLFRVDNFFNNSWHPRYVVLPGDERFVMISLQDGSGVTTTVVELNWLQGIQSQ